MGKWPIKKRIIIITIIIIIIIIIITIIIRATENNLIGNSSHTKEGSVLKCNIYKPSAVPQDHGLDRALQEKSMNSRILLHNNDNDNNSNNNNSDDGDDDNNTHTNKIDRGGGRSCSFKLF